MTENIKLSNGSYRLIVWHPSVHHKFGEQLYFFEVKPDTYNNWFKITIEEILRSCDVQGWCLYEVYGFYDVLIRAWMTHEQRLLFEKELNKQANIMKFNEFLANHTDYLWSNQQQEMPVLPERSLNKYDTDTLIAVQGKEGGESLSKEMQKCGLVLKDGKINTDKSFEGIKFYMKLSYTSQAYQTDVFDEIKEMIITDKIDKKKISKRKKNSCIITIDLKTLKTKIIDGKIPAKYKKAIKEAGKTKDKSINGSIGNKGKVKGKVQIIKNFSDIKKFKIGNILVANTTHPNYLPAMQKAQAFVTNEGGIISHAAIIARELKKPCIVGTKIATQILKNGDLVKVDANKGIVKKLQK